MESHIRVKHPGPKFATQYPIGGIWAGAVSASVLPTFKCKPTCARKSTIEFKTVLVSEADFANGKTSSANRKSSKGLGPSLRTSHAPLSHASMYIKRTAPIPIADNFIILICVHGLQYPQQLCRHPMTSWSIPKRRPRHAIKSSGNVQIDDPNQKFMWHRLSTGALRSGNFLHFNLMLFFWLVDIQCALNSAKDHVSKSLLQDPYNDNSRTEICRWNCTRIFGHHDEKCFWPSHRHHHGQLICF